MKLLGARSLSTFLKILLDIGFYIAILGTILLALVLGLVATFGGDSVTEELPIAFELDPSAYSLRSSTGEEVEAEIVEATGKLQITRPGGDALVLRMLVIFPVLAAVIVVLYKLRQLFRRLTEGRPFAVENAKTLRFIAGAVIGAELVWAAMVFWTNYQLAGEFTTTGISLRADSGIRMSVILAGLVLLIVAEVFRLGAEMKSDLETAREIQFTLLPDPDYRGSGVEIHSTMRPANTVGGDYYDVVELDDGRLAFVVADVAGKGIPAALLMALLQGSLRSLLASGLRGSELVKRLNTYLVANTPDNRMITFFYGELDPATGQLRYVNAGHNSPYLHDDSGLRRLEPTAVVLGVLDPAPFPEDRIQLNGDARLLIYTDGITEAANSSDEEYGEARLEKLLSEQPRTSSTSLIQMIVDRVVDFCGKAKPGDDMTLMVVTAGLGSQGVRSQEPGPSSCEES